MAKTIVITGVTSGIGKALSLHFAGKGERVIGIARSAERLATLETEIQARHPGSVFSFLICDLASFKAMQHTVERLKEMLPDGIDVLINNAAIVPKKKRLTVDGFEMQYQVNHLAPAFFTLGLMALIKTKRGRVITTSSNAHKKARFMADDIQALKRYHPLRSYARTKLYNILFTLGLRDHYPAEGVAFYAVHPGLVKTEIGTKDTSRFYALMWRLFTRRGFSPEETVWTYDALVYAPYTEAPYHYLSVPHEPSPVALNEINRRMLYDATLNDLAPYLK